MLNRTTEFNLHLINLQKKLIAMNKNYLKN